jgi:predicted dehydrogenase
MSIRSSRRRFLQTTAAAGSALSLGYFVNPSPAAPSKSPNEKLNIAGIGVTGRAGEDIRGVQHENIVALADCDANNLAKGAEAWKGSRTYTDFRVMLEKEADKIDAVVVGTPDHNHAPAAAMAMRLKKHVYCEKPLTHTVYEARQLANLAKENKLVTQMGNQIHSEPNYRRVVELIQAGAIGEVKEVHVWAGAQYTGQKLVEAPVPAGLNWDVWQGPAKERPFGKTQLSENNFVPIHPFHWRRLWDYGTGALGDFGCHFMDLAHWALKLRAPTSVSAEGPPVDAVICPAYTIAHYEYPARGDMPAVKLTWYDSGKRPELLNTIKDKNGKTFDWGGGQLFVGSKGMLISDYGRHVLLPEEKFADFKRPEPTIPNSTGHHKEWLEGIRTGSETMCNFDYAGALTEAVLLGTVAYRSGKKIEWDAANCKVTNSPEAQQLIHKEYRKGWTL